MMTNLIPLYVGIKESSMIQWVHKRLVFLLIYIHALCTLLGSLVAYRDEEANTIRHVNCQYLLKSVSSGNRCNSCVTFRNNTLRRELNRMKERESDETRDPASPSSHTNYRFLTTPERNERMQRLHKVVRAKTKSLEAMRKGISRILQNNSMKMDSDTHNDLLSIMRSYTAAVNKKFGEESLPGIVLAATVAGLLTWQFTFNEVAPSHDQMVLAAS